MINIRSENYTYLVLNVLYFRMNNRRKKRRYYEYQSKYTISDRGHIKYFYILVSINCDCIYFK